MKNEFKGRAWKYYDDVDTDVIIPARFLNTINEKELSSHCMEDIDKTFSQEVKDGDIIVAGENFGCGSSREHAPIAIKASGIKVVIAKTFARIFYRNAINIGLPIMEHPIMPDECEKNDIIECDLANGIIKNLTKNKEYQCTKFPKEIQDLILDGGLVNHTRIKLGVK